MTNIVVEGGKYIMIAMIAIYVYQSFYVLWGQDADKKSRAFRIQDFTIFGIHLIANLAMLLKTGNVMILFLYMMQVAMFLSVLWVYGKIYQKASRLVRNNMLLLLSIGFIIITRLSIDKALKQSLIVAAALALSFVIPVLIRKLKFLGKLRNLYATIGIFALVAVLVIGQVSGGAKLGFRIGSFGVQPSEFVKILFVFFVAASFHHSTKFGNVVFTTILAALHVLILAVSKDLGAALIIFVVYLVMLYVATRQPFYVLAGIGAGTMSAVMAYHLFEHVRLRVGVWMNPFADYENAGYQVTQSLFAIGTGGWFGTGLFRGKAHAIPVAAEDFVFSAISEEMGLLFAIGMLLVCVSCYMMILNIARQLHNQFYKLMALGLGTCYIFQTFLTVGGAMNFIPSTGVTLPLVSYGGSSALSTILMFAIIQGLYILKEEEEELERKRQQKQNRNATKKEENRRTKREGPKPRAN